MDQLIHNILPQGLIFMKWYFLIGTPIMLGAGTILFFAKKYRKNSKIN